MMGSYGIIAFIAVVLLVGGHYNARRTAARKAAEKRVALRAQKARDEFQEAQPFKGAFLDPTGYGE